MGGREGERISIVVMVYPILSNQEAFKLYFWLQMKLSQHRYIVCTREHSIICTKEIICYDAQVVFSIRTYEAGTAQLALQFS